MNFIPRNRNKVVFFGIGIFIFVMGLGGLMDDGHQLLLWFRSFPVFQDVASFLVVFAVALGIAWLAEPRLRPRSSTLEETAVATSKYAEKPSSISEFDKEKDPESESILASPRAGAPQSTVSPKTVQNDREKTPSTETQLASLPTFVGEAASAGAPYGADDPLGSIAPLDEQVPSPEIGKLIQMTSGRTELSKKAILKPYVGRFLSVSGRVRDVRETGVINSGIVVFVDLDEAESVPKDTSAICYMKEKHNSEYLAQVRRGDRFSVIGKFAGVLERGVGISLEECELEL